MPPLEIGDLLLAAKEGKLGTVKKAIKEGIGVNESPVLGVAAEHGHVDIVRWLLAQDGVDTDVTNKKKQTPLFRAANAGHTEIVRLLLEKGADVEKMNMSFDLLMIPNAEIGVMLAAAKAKNEDDLMSDIREGRIDMVRARFRDAFLKGRQVKLDWKHMRAALLGKNGDIVKLLVTWGATATVNDVQSLPGGEWKNAVKLLRTAGIRLDMPAIEEEEIDVLNAWSGKVDVWDGAPFEKTRHIDGRLTALPVEWRRVLYTFQERGGAEEAMIGGGALRDTYLKKPVGDVDIFLKCRGSEKKNRQFLEDCFLGAGLAIAYGGKLRPVTSEFVKEINTLYGDIIPGSQAESWRVNAGPDGTEYNIIFIKGGALSRCTASQFMIRVVNHFDFGFCQLATDGRDLIISPEFRSDVLLKQINLHNPSSGTTSERVERIVAKYQEWSLCEETQKALKKKPAAKKTTGLTKSTGPR